MCVSHQNIVVCRCELRQFYHASNIDCGVSNVSGAGLQGGVEPLLNVVDRAECAQATLCMLFMQYLVDLCHIRHIIYVWVWSFWIDKIGTDNVHSAHIHTRRHEHEYTRTAYRKSHHHRTYRTHTCIALCRHICWNAEADNWGGGNGTMLPHRHRTKKTSVMSIYNNKNGVFDESFAMQFRCYSSCCIIY